MEGIHTNIEEDIECREVCLDCITYTSENARQFYSHALKCRGKTDARRLYIDSVKRTLRVRSDDLLLDMLRSVPGAVRILSRSSKTIDITRDTTLNGPVHEAPGAEVQERSSKRQCLDVVQHLAQSSDQSPQPHAEGDAEGALNDEQQSEYRHMPVALPPPTGEMSLAGSSASDAGFAHTATDEMYDQLEPHTRAAQPGLIVPILRTNFNSTSHGARTDETRMRSEILEYMMARRGEQDINIKGYVEGELTLHQLEDLYSTIALPVGMHHDELKDAFADLWSCLEDSNAYVVERALQIPRSTCMCLEINTMGDFEVRVRVGRNKGLLFAGKYHLLRHVLFPLNNL